MDARALPKRKLRLALDDSLEDANGEIKRAKKEKGDLLNAAGDSKDAWQSDEDERAAERWHWEEHAQLKQEFLNDQYLQEAVYAKDGGKIGWTQHQHAAAMSVADKMGVRVGDAVVYSIRFAHCTALKPGLKDMTDIMLLSEIMPRCDLAC
ncbi:hypothetical protein O181_034367 [Austropuccinia psidii MF-1]|uniref:Uncharacterized protein n=1 Tax=Austropuccinia psidii MF-1 TaxID=1389203 RepID=A0A9Q3H809_9BASI|nr:hypothetical protein [Austropuccinia psidii MF-1]